MVQPHALAPRIQPRNVALILTLIYAPLVLWTLGYGFALLRAPGGLYLLPFFIAGGAFSLGLLVLGFRRLNSVQVVAPRRRLLLPYVFPAVYGSYGMLFISGSLAAKLAAGNVALVLAYAMVATFQIGVLGWAGRSLQTPLET